MQSLGDEVKDTLASVPNQAKELVDLTVDQTLSTMGIGFTLSAALAWNEYARTLIKKFAKAGPAHMHALIYALFASFLTAIYLMFSRRSKPQVVM